MSRGQAEIYGMIAIMAVIMIAFMRYSRLLVSRSACLGTAIFCQRAAYFRYVSIPHPWGQTAAMPNVPSSSRVLPHEPERYWLAPQTVLPHGSHAKPSVEPAQSPA